MSLNDKQRRFVNEYLIDLNATQAAIRAGYSQKTAYSHGERLLKNVDQTQQTYQNALQELSEFKPDIQVVSGLQKGDYKTHE